MAPRTEWLFTVAGWLLFTASAVFFTWSTVRANDLPGIIGSLFFLVACLVFMVPVWHLRPPRQEPPKEE